MSIIYRSADYTNNIEARGIGKAAGFGLCVFAAGAVILDIEAGGLSATIHLEYSALDVIIAECKAAQAAIAQHGAAQGQGARP
jgi:hypothetical protein